MVEIVVERWSNLDGSVEYRWSLWRDGRRLRMGGAHPSAEASEAEARAVCAQGLGQAPDRVTRL